MNRSIDPSGTIGIERASPRWTACIPTTIPEGSIPAGFSETPAAAGPGPATGLVGASAMGSRARRDRLPSGPRRRGRGSRHYHA